MNMKTRRPLTASEQLSAKRLKAIYLQRKAIEKSKGRKFTYETVADFMDMTPGAVSQFMNGSTALNTDACLRFSQFFDVQPSDINPDICDLLPNVTYGDKNVSSLSTKNEAVPLISWVQAGAFEAATAEGAESDAEKWILCPVPHSSQTFALRVHGLSMQNPGRFPSFDEGDIIHVDPSVKTENNSLVVVRMSGDS